MSFTVRFVNVKTQKVIAVLNLEDALANLVEVSEQVSAMNRGYC